MIVPDANAKKKKAFIFFGICAVFTFLYGIFAGPAITERGIMALGEGWDALSFKWSTFTDFQNWKWGAILTTLFLFVAFIWIEKQGNFRFGEEYGTAKWANPKKLAKKYGDVKHFEANKLYSENFYLSYDNEKTERNANALIIGGSGAGKTFRYAMPNLLQCSTTFVDIDPKGEHLAKSGNRLVKLGYDIKVLNLIQLNESDSYNPFKYIRETEVERDIEMMVDTIFTASTDGRGKSQDPFWDDSAKNVILALLYYVYYEYPKSRQHFGSVMDLKRKCNIKNQMGSCDFDRMIDELAKKKPDSLAVKYWGEYKGNDVKVKRDILAVVSSKLLKFNNPALVNMTRFDDMDFDSLGERKRVLFIVISDTDTSMNFIVSMLYTQLFQRLFNVADFKYRGALPVHVHILMDEFANIKLPDDFDKVLATMRSRNVSASIIIQNLAQIKNIYEKQWEGMVGNCDVMMYLGGNEYGTAEYVSKLLGKYTLDTKSWNFNTSMMGGGGSSGGQKSQIARELLSPDEIRKMPNDQAIVLIRGEDPMLDYKLNPLKLETRKYSVYDKVEGAKYIRVVKDMFEYDDEVMENLDPSNFDYTKAEELDMRGYYFKTSDEIKAAAVDLNKADPRRHQHHKAYTV